MNWLAYPLSWAYNAALRTQAARWQRRGLLSPAQLAAVQAAYPLDYYRPVFYLRVLLFFFTSLGLGSVGGYLAVLTDFEPLVTSGVGAVGCFTVLELVVRRSRHYGSGLDTALLYAGLGCVGAFVGVLVARFFPAPDSSWLGFFQTVFVGALYVALLAAAAVRYADRLLAAAAYLLALAVVAYFSALAYAISKALLPFLLMLASAGAHALVRRLPRLGRLYAAYAECALVLEVLTLTTFYLAGNYYAVREGNAALAHISSPSTQIPFAPLFYVFTAVVPFVYIAAGLRQHRRVPLLVGVLTLAFSIFTLRYYRAVLPPEIAATAAGAVLIALAAVGLRYLRPQRHGLTSLPDDEVPHFDLEALLVAQTATVPAAPEPQFQFGGGQSGGGGATGAF